MIQAFADWLVYTVFGLSPESHWGSAVNFFFYDSIKITILLFFISVIMGIINAYFPIDRLRHYLTTRKWKNRSRLGQCAGADWDTFDAAKLMIFSETVAF